MRSAIVSATIANEKDFLTTRLAYKLNLRGPALNIQTACSSSLVAVCVACQHLLDHQCDAALAGGVSLTFPQDRGYLLSGRRHDFARWLVPALRCARERHGLFQRRGRRGAEAPRRRPRRGRPDLRGDQRPGAQQRRLAKSELRRAERRWPRRGDRASASNRRRLARQHLLSSKRTAPPRRSATRSRSRASRRFSAPLRRSEASARSAR